MNEKVKEENCIKDGLKCLSFVIAVVIVNVTRNGKKLKVNECGEGGMNELHDIYPCILSNMWRPALIGPSVSFLNK